MVITDVSLHTIALARCTDGDTSTEKVGSQGEDTIAQPSPHPLFPLRMICYLGPKALALAQKQYTEIIHEPNLVHQSFEHEFIWIEPCMCLLKTVYTRVVLGNKQLKYMFVAKDIIWTEEVGGRYDALRIS